MKNYLHLKEITIKEIFRVTIIFKWIIASLQLIGGFILLFISKNILTNGIILITHGELIEDSKDHIANYIIQLGHFLLNAKLIIVFYLLFHGIIKFCLLYGLWKNKLSAYPISAIIFSMFLTYQLYLYSFSHSIWLLFLSIFDIFYIYLILHEYKILKKATKN
jgi:uncharacterized membrane protein